MPLKPIQNSISSALPSRSLPPLWSTTFACISPHIRSPKLLNRYCWKECLHFLVSIPSYIACVGLSFFFFFPYGMPSKQSSEGKMNTAHLFLNSAKSSQSGNRKKKRKVLGVIESYFFSAVPPLILRTSGCLPFRMQPHSNLTLSCLLSDIRYCRSHAIMAFCQHDF